MRWLPMAWLSPTAMEGGSVLPPCSSKGEGWLEGALVLGEGEAAKISLVAERKALGGALWDGQLCAQDLWNVGRGVPLSLPSLHPRRGFGLSDLEGVGCSFLQGEVRGHCLVPCV